MGKKPFANKREENRLRTHSNEMQNNKKENLVNIFIFLIKISQHKVEFYVFWTYKKCTFRQAQFN